MHRSGSRAQPMVEDNTWEGREEGAAGERGRSGPRSRGPARVRRSESCDSPAAHSRESGDRDDGRGCRSDCATGSGTGRCLHDRGRGVGRGSETESEIATASESANGDDSDDRAR